MMKDIVHPQTKSFSLLFPKPASDISSKCGLSEMFSTLWHNHFNESSISFIGLSAKAPTYDHNQAQIAGNDYSCRLYANFKSSDHTTGDLKVLLGNIPYPDENGEFVLRGNRYYVPVVLCPEAKYEKFKDFLKNGYQTNSDNTAEKIDTGQQANSRKTDSLRIFLLDELLNHRLLGRLDWVIMTLKNRLWEGDISVLRTLLRRWLNVGKHSDLHKYIYRHGKLIDLENPLSRISQQKEMTFYYPGIIHPDTTSEFSLRDVDDDDLYRICPVQTPQGHKVGLNIYLARCVSIDLNTRQLIAPDSPQSGDSLSDGASLIPFIEHDDISRALMGTNMMKQTLPLEKPEAPLIQTGWEKTLGRREEVSASFKSDGILAIGKNLLSAYIPWGLETFEDGIVISESAAADLKSKHEKTFWFNQQKSKWWEGDYRPIHITAKNPRIPEDEKQYLDEEGIVKSGTQIKPGDVLVSAYMTKYQNINKTKMIDVFVSDNSVDNLLGKSPEEIRDVSLRMPHNFKGKVTKIIDSNKTPSIKLASGTIRRIGIVVQRDEPARVGDKIASRHGAKGVIVRILPDREMPYLKTEKSYCNDSGCHVRESHRHIQVILNPLGVTGRLNVGQLYETALAKIAEYENKPIIVKPFEKHWSPSLLSKELVSRGFSVDGKEQLYMNEGNIEIPLRYKSFAGPQYFLRLHHLAEDKNQGRGNGKPYDYSLRDNQPNKGKRLRGTQIIGSGQRVGEMETWALASHAAWNLLDDLLTIKSDDNRLRKIINSTGVGLDEYRRPQALVNLVLIFKSLGLDLRLKNKSGIDVTRSFLESPRGEIFNEVTLSLAKTDLSDEWLFGGQIASLNMYADLNSSDDLDKILPDADGLLSRIIFNPLKPWQMGQIAFACRIKPKEPGKKKKYFKYFQDEYSITHLAVPPVYFRHERLGYSNDFQDDLNIHYRNILQINAQLKAVLGDEKAECELRDLLKKKLEYAVGMLFSGGKIYGKYRRSILDIIKGKEGLIRGHLSGKRTDYSGRAVIVCDPTLSLDEASIPESLWQKLLPGANKNEKPVGLLNRQPSLHRYSFQAFRLSCHQRDNVIRLNPFVCKPFNADFDGDTIAIHVPRTFEAKFEVEKLLPSRNLLSQANGKMVLGFDKDIALAAAYITHHPLINSDEEISFICEDELDLNGRDVWDEIEIKGVKTTVGRMLLQRLFGKVSISNQCMGKDEWNDNLEKLTKIGLKNDPYIIPKFTKDMSKLFDDTLKKSGLSVSLVDFLSFGENDQSSDRIPSFLWLLKKIGKYNDDLEKQIVKKRGRMRYPGSDNDLTESIESCLISGHTEEEYLCSAHGARAGLVDKGLITAFSGHLLRDLIYNLQHIYIVEKDCRTSNGLNADEVEIDHFLGNRFNTDGSRIEESKKNILFRSPLTCQAKDAENHTGICQKCYGYDPATGQFPEIGLPVGILAAQAVGERVSQETLKSFHTGGVKEKGKKGSTLVKYLRTMFSTETKDTVGEVRNLNEIYIQFPRSGCPNLVHFEVILLGYKQKQNKIKRHNFLSESAFSQTPEKLINNAINKSRDDLNDVISRIVSARLSKTEIEGAHDA